MLEPSTILKEIKGIKRLAERVNESKRGNREMKEGRRGVKGGKRLPEHRI